MHVCSYILFAKVSIENGKNVDAKYSAISCEYARRYAVGYNLAVNENIDHFNGCALFIGGCPCVIGKTVFNNYYLFTAFATSSKMSMTPSFKRFSYREQLKMAFILKKSSIPCTSVIFTHTVVHVACHARLVPILAYFIIRPSLTRGAGLERMT